jgi:hypothetical protein
LIRINRRGGDWAVDWWSEVSAPTGIVKGAIPSANRLILNNLLAARGNGGIGMSGESRGES